MRVLWITKFCLRKCFRMRRLCAFVIVCMSVSFACVLLVCSLIRNQQLNTPWYQSRLASVQFREPVSPARIVDAITEIGVDSVNGYALIADVDHSNGVGFTGMYGTLWEPIEKAGPIMRSDADNDGDFFRLERDVIPLEYIHRLSDFSINVAGITLQCAGLVYQGSSWDYTSSVDAEPTVQILTDENQPMALPLYAWEVFEYESEHDEHMFCTHGEDECDHIPQDNSSMEEPASVPDLSEYTRSVMVNSAWFVRHDVPVIGFAVAYKNPESEDKFVSLIEYLEHQVLSYQSPWNAGKRVFHMEDISAITYISLALLLMALLCSLTVMVGWIRKNKKVLRALYITGAKCWQMQIAVLIVGLVGSLCALAGGLMLYAIVLRLEVVRDLFYPLSPDRLVSISALLISCCIATTFIRSKKWLSLVR